VCIRGGDVGGLNAVKRACFNWKADVVGFVTRDCRRCKEQSCCVCDLKLVRLSGWVPPQLTHFGGVQLGFFAFPSCVRLVSLDVPGSGGHITEVGRVAETLAV
jgi:hypothetical protein